MLMGLNRNPGIHRMDEPLTEEEMTYAKLLNDDIQRERLESVKALGYENIEEYEQAQKEKAKNKIAEDKNKEREKIDQELLETQLKIDAFKNAVANGKEDEYLSNINFEDRVDIYLGMRLNRNPRIHMIDEPLTEEEKKYAVILETYLKQDMGEIANNDVKTESTKTKGK